MYLSSMGDLPINIIKPISKKRRFHHQKWWTLQEKLEFQTLLSRQSRWHFWSATEIACVVTFENLFLARRGVWKSFWWFLIPQKDWQSLGIIIWGWRSFLINHWSVDQFWFTPDLKTWRGTTPASSHWWPDVNMTVSWLEMTPFSK